MTDQRNDIDAERSLLAACLESKRAREEARKHIVPSDLFEPIHEAIWNAMATLDRAGHDVDLVSVSTMLRDRERGSDHALAQLVGIVGFPDHVATYAAIVRGWSTRRRIESTARGAIQRALDTNVNPTGLAATVTNEFAAIRDTGTTEDDFTAVTVAELLADEDDEPDWIIPGLFERRDRLMLTGEEGLGKSHWLRQMALHAAAGIHPLDSMTRFDPIRTLILDCENTLGQVRRKIRGAAAWLEAMDASPDGLMVDCWPRIDITRDRDLSRIHQLLDVWNPDMVVIGPLYRLVPRAIQTDDDAAPVLAALDTLRDRGCTLLMEAHAGHAVGKGGQRDLRPRGSSALLGWPEFGFGLRSIGTAGYADVVQWRGPREERNWPQRLKKADGFRWVPYADLYGYDQGGYVA